MISLRGNWKKEEEENNKEKQKMKEAAAADILISNKEEANKEETRWKYLSSSSQKSNMKYWKTQANIVWHRRKR